MSKNKKIVVVTLISGIILALCFGIGYNLGSGGRLSPEPGLDTVVQAWNIIVKEHVDSDKLDKTELSEAAIRGMVEVLDDNYAAFLDTETYQLSLTGLEGMFEGIGATVSIEDEQLTIIAPFADSPAAKAGIRSGDIVLEINGVSTSGMSLTEAVLKIRGPKGTPVKLLVRHTGESNSEEIEVIRNEIVLHSVLHEMRGDIAYIQITHFYKRTAEELYPVLQDITQAGADGIILDLRGNPGGLLQEVVDVTSFFLEEGIVVKVVDSEGKYTVLSVKPREIVTDLPVIVLVDEFSASGSEVLAGALRDNGRATIAGTRTYGKGSVQGLRQLKDGSGLYITIARWLTPNGDPIDGEGLPPDYELELDGEDAIEWAIDYLKNQ